LVRLAAWNCPEVKWRWLLTVWCETSSRVSDGYESVPEVETDLVRVTGYVERERALLRSSQVSCPGGLRVESS
jgi:hypothetical protein